MAKNKTGQQRGVTVRDLWDYLGVMPDDGSDPPIPVWPPDLFAMCAAVLKKSGAYTVVFDQYNDSLLGAKEVSEASCPRTSGRRRNIKRAAMAWRQIIAAQDPKALSTRVSEDWAIADLLWQSILPDLDREIHKLLDHGRVCMALVDLMAIADETCRGIGLPGTSKVATAPVAAAQSGSKSEKQYDPEWVDARDRAFETMAGDALFPREFGSTLCKAIHPSIARVLPKMHTAQCGLTVRSFSHHLAYCESDEVRPSWFSVPGSRGDASDIHRMNILIAPWPLKIKPSQISNVKADDLPYNSFEVELEFTEGRVADRIAALAEAAKDCVGKIDAVIMPELALTTRDHRLVRTALIRKGILLIAGVGSRQRRANYLQIDVPISKHHAVHLRQRKHHRWKLDGGQIGQYHIGSRLDPDKRYWENLDVQNRQLRFIVLRPWLVTTALICEDLARHDPVGDLIKGVGPNLVIALLMDGPQITTRWSSRYAAGLADDPGCSVLSVTSLGMAQLSRSRNDDGKNSRVIGLWKDALSGQATEIEVKPNHEGVVITLVMSNGVEKTADFRSDRGVARYPSLSGFHSIKLPPEAEIQQIPNFSDPPQWLSIFEASELAKLAQRPSASSGFPDALDRNFMPSELTRLHGSAFRIGREIWRQKTSGPDEDKPDCGDDTSWASPAEEETAKEIINWDNTNRMMLG